MSLLENYVPVYESSSNTKIRFYFSASTSDCVLCLSFHIEPTVTNCGHIFCKNCLELNLVHFGVCPICFNYISETFSIKWHFFNDLVVNEWSTFKKIKYKDGENIDNYGKNPHSRKYYIEGEGSFTGDYFYQVIDGGNYFLDSCYLISKYKSWNKMPEFIVGRIRQLKRVEINKKNSFGLKPHIGLIVYIVKLY